MDGSDWRARGSSELGGPALWEEISISNSELFIPSVSTPRERVTFDPVLSVAFQSNTRKSYCVGNVYSYKVKGSYGTFTATSQHDPHALVFLPLILGSPICMCRF